MSVKDEHWYEVGLIVTQVKKPGAPFLAFFARKPALSEVEGWGFSPPRYQLSASPPPLRFPSMAPPCDEWRLPVP